MLDWGDSESCRCRVRLLDFFVKRVLSLVAAVLHELQTMWRRSLVLRGGVARYTRLSGLPAGGAFKVDDDTTLCSFFGHGVLRRF